MVGVVAGALVLVAVPGRAHAADAVTLRVGPNPVAYGGRVAFSGAVSPRVPGETVGVYTRSGDTWKPVASATTDARGAFSRILRITGPGVFIAQGVDAVGTPVDSAPVSIVVRPIVETALRGSRRIGDRLFVAGRIVPRAAGRLTVAEGDRAYPVRVGPTGIFRADLTTTRLFRYRAVLRLHPSRGYAGWQRTHRVRVKLRPLSLAASGAAVEWLEDSLYRIHHFALPGADSTYDGATVDAVLAFQKVHGLPRTGAVDARFWEILRTSGPPVARVRVGDHIEVDKTRQILFEVRGGKVVSVTQVSTGATGNTPPGHWRVYAKSPGYNALGMYDSLYFLRGFAIHGYYSVPAYPASHGCVRTPVWVAPGIYARWGVGASVYVFA